jgi:hypothetical protein
MAACLPWGRGISLAQDMGDEGQERLKLVKMLHLA